MRNTIKFPGKTMWVEMDIEQIFPDDPGMGTPVLVVLNSGETGTWNCVTSTGEVEGVILSDEQKEWLASITPAVEHWMQLNGV